MMLTLAEKSHCRTHILSSATALCMSADIYGEGLATETNE